MNGKYFIFLIVLNLLFSSLFSQIIKFEGKVVDDQDKPLIGANVYIKSKGCGVETNSNGYFNLPCSEANNNDTLFISFLGFEDYTIALKDFKNYSTIQLTRINLKIQDEIVVYGEKIDICRFEKNT